PTTVQTNTMKTEPKKLENALQAVGAEVTPHPWLEGCFEVSGTGDLERMELFREGMFTVQDAAARLVSTVAQCAEEDNVLDVCSAPGGKSFAIAIDRNDHGKIISCDIHPHKLKLIEKGAERLGLTSITPALADGREEHTAWVGAADVVVADVPCSGLGIIRKNPDIRYKKAAELANLPAIQREILHNASRYVRDGGTLVYSTCTVLPEENEEVVAWFLENHPEFTLSPFELPHPLGKCEGMLTLWPHRHGTDGFFICRMVKE
ncbi:MAG: methyltransferase domain-containing protein, partial [Oscillospiraceae bacterium]|nr:methyltransferase domain-containing protein [Oscillospiraceae bacterium]